MFHKVKHILNHILTLLQVGEQISNVSKKGKNFLKYNNKEMKMRNSIASLDYIRTDCFNRYASTIYNPLESSFCDYILPHRLVEKICFKKTEAQLYISNRGSVNIEIPLQNLKHFNNGYEDVLHRIFWKNEDRRKLIFIIGTIGCGKSTFLDYFLRCYCPSQFNYNENSPKKLILHIDFKGANNIDDFLLRILDGIQLSLKMNKIYSDFDSIINGSGDKDERVIKVLQKISKNIEDKRYSFKYLTICFDNIDQSPLDIQVSALSMAQRLIEESSEIKIYKIFFPLWPKTLKSFKLKNILKLSSAEYLSLALPHPNLKLLYIKRIKKLLNDIGESDRVDIKRFIKSINYRIDDSNKKFLFDISYGNLKVMGILFSDLLKSHAIDQYKLMYNNIRDYQFLDSLICGCKYTHNTDNSLILNPYFIFESSASFGETLIFGYFLMYFEEQSYDYAETLDFFLKLKFKKALISDTLEVFANYRLIHFDYYEGGNRQINVHHKVIKAYFKILTDPATIDNFAQTTPIDEQFVIGRKPTLGYDDAHFTRRVENTISFLTFLKKEENTFISKHTEDELTKIREKIPSLSQLVKNSYIQRLKALKARGMPKHPTVSESWWLNIFDSLKKL